VRAFIIMVTLVGPLLSAKKTQLPPGAMALLMICSNIGSYFLGVCYLMIFMSSRKSRDILLLINLIKGDHQHHDTKGKKLLRQNVWIVSQVVFLFLLNVVVYIIYAASYVLSKGITNGARTAWYRYIQVDMAKASQDDEPNDYYWWKRVVGFSLLFGQMDLYLNLGSVLVLFMLIAKTMETICTHFTSSVRDTQKFCKITTKEVYIYIYKYRWFRALQESKFSHIKY